MGVAIVDAQRCATIVEAGCRDGTGRSAGAEEDDFTPLRGVASAFPQRF